MKPKEFAQRLGETFAVLQHGADLGVEWALKKVSKLQEEQRKEEQRLTAELKEIRGEENKKPKEPATSALGSVLGSAKTFFQMLTDIGETYYKRYAEIKKDTVQ